MTEPASDSALLERRSCIGSSDAPAVLGVSPYKTPLQLYLEKTGEQSQGGDEANAKAKARGKRLEPYVVDMLREELGITPVARNVVRFDRDLPFLRAETDLEYVLPGDDVVRRAEIKTVHPFMAREWGEAGTDEIPIHYTAQAMHGMMIDGHTETLFAVLIGDDLRLFKVARDDQLIARLREREIAFWNEHVLARVPPPPSTSSDVLALFSADLGTIAEADETILATVERLRELKVAAKEIEALEERIKVFMGPAATLTYQGRILATWKAQTAQRLDQKAFRAAHPELYESFQTACSTRVLRIK